MFFPKDLELSRYHNVILHLEIRLAKPSARVLYRICGFVIVILHSTWEFARLKLEQSGFCFSLRWYFRLRAKQTATSRWSILPVFGTQSSHQQHPCAAQIFNQINHANKLIWVSTLIVPPKLRNQSHIWKQGRNSNARCFFLRMTDSVDTQYVGGPRMHFRSQRRRHSSTRARTYTHPGQGELLPYVNADHSFSVVSGPEGELKLELWNCVSVVNSCCWE